jgi:hypothetical protein
VHERAYPNDANSLPFEDRRAVKMYDGLQCDIGMESVDFQVINTTFIESYIAN